MPETDSSRADATGPHAPLVEIVPGPRVDGTIRPPGSKSLTNRALICAAFARGRSNLSGALRSEDTEVMIGALEKLGVAITVSDGGRELSVDGSNRERAGHDGETFELFMANSGTSIRFLTAALSAVGGNYRLHGVPRMHERPIRDLVLAIESVLEGSIATESSGGARRFGSPRAAGVAPVCRWPAR